MKDQLSIFEQIQELAHRDARTHTGEKHYLLFLMTWWSDKYNRPLKDPLLATYTLEELSYEYCLSNERVKAIRERDEEENDKIEEAKAQADDEWANQMEEEDEVSPKYSNPLENPENVKWMEEEIERNKQEFGEDFGDDFNIDF